MASTKSAPAPGTASELRGVVSAIAGAVTEAPARHRTYPTAPLYGRGFIVMLQGGKTVCTGERAEIMLGESRLPWR